MRIETQLGLDGLWHAVRRKPCGELESLASGPDQQQAQIDGEDVVLHEMFGGRLYPYQMTLARFYLRGGHENAIVVHPRKMGLRTIAELQQAARRTLPPHLWPRSA